VFERNDFVRYSWFLPLKQEYECSAVIFYALFVFGIRLGPKVALIYVYFSRTQRRATASGVELGPELRGARPATSEACPLLLLKIHITKIQRIITTF